MMETQAATATAIGGISLSPVPGSGEVLRVEKLCKIYRSGGHEIAPINDAELSVARGEMIAIVGPSGSGKSTLLHMLAALDTPTSGAVYFAESSLASLTGRQLADYRNRAIEFVWQRHHLLPDFTAAENVAMPLLVRGESLVEALQAARGWLGEVGLSERAEQRAGELSGGEQQRVAIARALVNHPVLLLADEPTGDLDEGSAEGIFDLLERLHQSHQLTSILATHNLSLAGRTDRVLQLEHGKLAPAREVLGNRTASTKRSAGIGANTPGERG